MAVEPCDSTAQPGNPSVAIGLIDFNTPERTEEAVQHLRGFFPSAEIIVVQNGRLAGNYDQSVRIINPGRNSGFAGGCNFLIQAAQNLESEALWILNNDCVVTAASLERYESVSRDVEGDVYTSVALLGESSAIWYAGGLHDAVTLKQTHCNYGMRVDEARLPSHFRTEWASGANLYIPRRTFERASLFDEHLFLYLEELDWQLRNRFAVICLGEPLVRHYAGSTTAALSTDLEFFFIARNRVVLHSRRQASLLTGVRFWASWSLDNLLKPLLRGRWRRARTALTALRSTGVSGTVALDRALGRRS